MPYTIEIAPSAQRDAKALPGDLQGRIRPAVSLLAAQPRPPGREKLAGTQNRYRIRVGDYRVVYEVRDSDQTVLVVAIRHRRDVYRRR